MYALHYMDPNGLQACTCSKFTFCSFQLAFQMLLHGVVYKLPSCYSIHHRQPNFFDFGYLPPRRTSPRGVATRIHMSIFPIKGDESCFPRTSFVYPNQNHHLETLWKDEKITSLARKKTVCSPFCTHVTWVEYPQHYIIYYMLFISFTSVPQKLRDQISSKRFYPATPQNSSFLLLWLPTCFVDCLAILLVAFFWGGEMLIIKRAPFKGCQFLPPTKSWFLKVTACLNRHPR